MGLNFKDCMKSFRASIKQANYVNRKLGAKSTPQSTQPVQNSLLPSQNSPSCSQNVIQSSQLQEVGNN